MGNLHWSVWLPWLSAVAVIKVRTKASQGSSRSRTSKLSVQSAGPVNMASRTLMAATPDDYRKFLQRDWTSLVFAKGWKVLGVCYRQGPDISHRTLRKHLSWAFTLRSHQPPPPPPGVSQSGQHTKHSGLNVLLGQARRRLSLHARSFKRTFETSCFT